MTMIKTAALILGTLLLAGCETGGVLQPDPAPAATGTDALEGAVMGNDGLVP
jgi:hypothetical protein